MRVNDPRRSTMHEKSRFKGIAPITGSEQQYRINLKDETGRIGNPIFSRREVEVLASKANLNLSERNFFREALAELDSQDAEKSAQESKSSDAAAVDGVTAEQGTGQPDQEAAAPVEAAEAVGE